MERGGGARMRGAQEKGGGGATCCASLALSSFCKASRREFSISCISTSFCFFCMYTTENNGTTIKHEGLCWHIGGLQGST
jgi:hypothetical protein